MRIENIRELRDGSTVSVANTGATLLAGKQKNRTALLIQNADGSNAIKVGSQTAISGGTHISVPAGETYTYYGAAPIYAQAASGTINVKVVPIVGVPNNLENSTHTQVAVTSTRKLILQRNRKRVWVAISNIGSGPVAIGSKHVLYASKGITLAAGKFIVLPGSDELWAINTGTNEVQELTFAGTPDGGTYTMTWGGITYEFAYNASAGTLQAAFESHPLIGSGNITVVSSTGKFTITFQNELAAMNVDPFVVDDTDVTGEDAAVTLSTKTAGASATSVNLNLREEKFG